MQKHGYDNIDHRNQDKVRIRVGDYKGQKGTIQNLALEKLEILLENGYTIQILPGDVTNYSLAARKAWQTIRSRAK